MTPSLYWWTDHMHTAHQIWWTDPLCVNAQYQWACLTFDLWQAAGDKHWNNQHVMIKAQPHRRNVSYQKHAGVSQHDGYYERRNVCAVSFTVTFCLSFLFLTLGNNSMHDSRAAEPWPYWTTQSTHTGHKDTRSAQLTSVINVRLMLSVTQITPAWASPS